MYVYSEYDQKIIEERVAQYRGQTERFLAGDLSEDEFLVLRLQNGLYVQRHAPMLRIAIPHGMFTAVQMRKMAELSRTYDKGYAHFTTRQNLQLNWPKLEQVPDILEELASVQMHAIQTSGNCIRNTTSDQYAGVAKDETVDPRPYCEIIRQWSTFHPEFALLGRKFKIAVSGSKQDRAAVQVHDVGLYLTHNSEGQLGFKVYVGGGLGRTPVVAPLVNEFVAEHDILSYLEAVLRVYNRNGRRDNKYKARIKILVRAMTPEVFAEKVNQEWAELKDGPMKLPQQEIDRVKACFQPPAYEQLDAQDSEFLEKLESDGSFKVWVNQNVADHKVDGYSIVNISLKDTSRAPGDVSAEDMEIIADLADKYSFSELRSTHTQNLVLADVKQNQLYELWQTLKTHQFATPNIGLLTDMICCPGGDFCALANAKSIPIAEQIQRRFDDLDTLHNIGELELNISGCMNACGHHHVGNIGVLGVDKKGSEFYQISIGGSSKEDAAIGKILGPSFDEDDVADVVEKIINVYVEQRTDGERFIDTCRRIGIDPFKERVYAKNN
ncbi:MAG: sulfite reductase [Gammaproteobacteria bacterium]|nr:MAG: sulfite reductase [Gammaproteobacteria bacterium]